MPSRASAIPLARASLAVALFALALLRPGAASADCSFTLRVAARGVWEATRAIPQENLADVRILAAVAERLDWCLRWESRDTNIRRRLAMLRSGQVDVLVGASRTEDRAVYARFSQAYRDESVRLFVLGSERRSYAGVQSFDALLDTGARLLAIRDCWLGPDYARRRDQLLAAHRVYEVDTYAQASGMLQLGRGDVLLAPDSFADFLATGGGEAIDMLGWKPYHAPVYFMFSRRTVSAGRVEAFNAALQAVLRGPGAS